MPETIAPEPLIPEAVTAVCRDRGYGAIVGADPLQGGAISLTRRLHTATGRTLVLKQSTVAPPTMYALEAEGLQRLTLPGAPRTPEVLAVAETFLLLEDLGSGVTPRERYWEEFGRALAHQHNHTSPRFGFDHDNYLGLLPQHNPWTTDGHAFTAQHRILRYLPEPLCAQTLTAND